MACKEKLASVTTYLHSLQSRADLAKLGELLSALNVTLHDVADKCVFGEKNYRRNEIASSEWFDLLLICWRPGQASAIHDHAGSSCAFKVISGDGVEIRYQKLDEHDPHSVVRPVASTTYRTGDLCLASDADTHKILNQSEANDLVTLHIYSPPLHMNFYEEVKGNSPLIIPEGDEARILSGAARPRANPGA